MYQARALALLHYAGLVACAPEIRPEHKSPGQHVLAVHLRLEAHDVVAPVVL